MVGLPFGHHSTMALCAMVVQASSTSIPVYRTPPSVPSPQDVSSPPTAVLCLGLLSRPHIPAPSPCLHWWTPSQTGWAGLGSVPCVQVSLCPAATRWLLCSLPTENEALLLSRLSSPSEGLPGIWRPLLTFISPQGCRPQPNFSPLPFPSSCSPLPLPSS